MNGFRLGQLLANQAHEKLAFGLAAKNLTGLGVGAGVGTNVAANKAIKNIVTSKGIGGNKVFKGLSDNVKRTKETAKAYNPSKPPSSELAKPKVPGPEIKMNMANKVTPTGPMQAVVPSVPAPPKSGLQP